MSAVPSFRPLLLCCFLSLAIAGTAAAQGRAFLFKKGNGRAPRIDSVSVFADGNLRQGLGNDNGGTIPGGALGIGLTSTRFNLDLLINIAGNESALTRNHASTILAPGSGGSLAAGFVEGRFRPGERLGLRLYGSISSAEWADTASTISSSVVIGGIGAGPFLNLFGGNIEGADGGKTHVAGVFDIGIAWRGLGGDLVTDGTGSAKQIFLGTSNAPNIGLELGLTLQVNDLRAGFTYYYFGGRVPGLSKGQVVAGFSVSSALVSGRLK
jgi:hypothetical protein